MRDVGSAPNAETTANRVAPAVKAARATFTTKSKSTWPKGGFRPGDLDRGADRDEHVIHCRERCGQPCEVDLVNLQLCTGLDVRRRAPQQDMHATVMPAGKEQGQKRATDEAGRAGKQGGARC